MSDEEIANTGDNESKNQNTKEGANAVAYDLAQARFKLHDNRTKIDRAELRKKYSWAAIFVSLSLWLPIALLNFTPSPPINPLWTNIGGIVVTLTAIVTSAFFISKFNKDLVELWDLRRKHRDSEKSARLRLPDNASRNILWHYHSDVAASIDEYRSGASKQRKVGNWFQGFIIVFSVAVSLLVTASSQFPALQWAGVAASFLVATATSLNGYFKFRERGVNMQRAADDLEYEYNSAELGINSYRDTDDDVNRLKDFAEKTEKIKLDQRKREQQLEQGPQSRSAANNEGSQ
ncbi:DUF4231 domain-containing protein [Nocardiopsis suaedae]|uniref:DUF4231 domain-containing protein n=1 Tax=Nocardiopsis suaedae TaxID=3018444 RepID=A0ABT4TIA8_9ACTN|nr:DUF4231 domain-containing protein [Nocardiopsis suaedae]MDA2804444.1 DUF4231 domain-containing protein [Nocardiopsis suaedae]